MTKSPAETKAEAQSGRGIAVTWIGIAVTWIGIAVTRIGIAVIQPLRF